MSWWISVMFRLLLEVVLQEFDNYLAIYTFLTLQQQTQSQKKLG
jgi:hypothetical protein